MPTSTSLKKLVRHLAKHGPFKTLPHPKRIRILFNGTFVADTTSALYVWEHEFYPQLYLPMHAFTNTPGVDVKLSYGDAIESDEGQIVGGEVKLAVRRTGTGFEEDYMVLEEMVLFAADLDGPANVLRDHVKVVFQAVGEFVTFRCSSFTSRCNSLKGQVTSCHIFGLPAFVIYFGEHYRSKT